MFVEVISALSTCLLGADLLKTSTPTDSTAIPSAYFSRKKNRYGDHVPSNYNQFGKKETVWPQVAKGVQW